MRIRVVFAAMALTIPALVEAQNAAPAAPPAGRTTGGGITQDRMDSLAQKHDGYYGALAPQNLKKPRPKPPFDLTGTWFVDLRRSFADFRFGPPYPEFYEPGQTALREAEEARKKGVPYRDTIGRCFPAGMPMIMTRVWPTSMVQLPTVVYQLFGFTSSMRFIYLDGRKFTDPDVVSYTYNGESIGRWEGDALVVHTKYLEPKEHYIDSGIPISDQFEIIERYTHVEGRHDAARRLHDDRSEDVEGRMEEQQGLPAPGLQRHSRGGVPAEPEREPAQHARRAEGHQRPRSHQVARAQKSGRR